MARLTCQSTTVFSGRLHSTGTSITDSYTYDFFGVKRAGTGNTSNPFRFKSKSGFYYLLDFVQYSLPSQYYDPAVGRFLSQGLPRQFQKSNRYQYDPNKPPGAPYLSGLLANPINALIWKTCFNVAKWHASHPNPDPLTPLQEKCCEIAYDFIVHPPFWCPRSACQRAIQVLLQAITTRCREPARECKACNFAAQFHPGPPPTITVCGNARSATLCWDIYHELIHAYQDCYPVYWQGVSSCLESLKTELQAYMCDGSCKNKSFLGCYLEALGSSCFPAGPCRPWEAMILYDQVSEWYYYIWRKLGGNICRWPTNWTAVYQGVYGPPWDR
jgi:hypothetical protein